MLARVCAVLSRVRSSRSSAPKVSRPSSRCLRIAKSLARSRSIAARFILPIDYPSVPKDNATNATQSRARVASPILMAPVNRQASAGEGERRSGPALPLGRGQTWAD